MARFDVYANTGPHASHTPYLLDVQSDWLQGLETRVVVPLRKTSHFPSVKLPDQLCPVFTLTGEECLLETPKMAAVPLRVLRSPVASLATEQARIVAALDFLFQGY